MWKRIVTVPLPVPPELPARGQVRGAVFLLLALALLAGCRSPSGTPVAQTPERTAGVTAAPEMPAFTLPYYGLSLNYPEDWAYQAVGQNQWYFFPLAAPEDDTPEDQFADEDEEDIEPVFDPRVTPYILLQIRERPPQRPWDERELYYAMEDLLLPFLERTTPEPPRAIKKSDLTLPLWQTRARYQAFDATFQAVITVARLDLKSKLVLYGVAQSDMAAEMETAYAQMLVSLRISR